jgi:hypothetical protein
MNREEFADFLHQSQETRASWLATAKVMRENAKLAEEHDPALATMARRLALAIEQFEERIDASLTELSLDNIDQQMEEKDQEDKMITELFDRIKRKS